MTCLNTVYEKALMLSLNVLQNGAVTAARPDYSSMPLLAAPPQVGQKIAFKVS